jgi:hypothetical protein
LTFVPATEFDNTIAYTSWGDLGNVMGRVFHKMGLHYGHTGLSFWIRQGMFDKAISWSDSDHVYEKFVLTRDVKKIFEIGGFSYQRWIEGFDTQEEVFQFVASSMYFDPDIFKIENLNHINRVRNRKREMYMNFVQWLESQSLTAKKAYLSKENYSLLLQLEYPPLQTAIDKWHFHHSVINAIKVKFNGSLIKDWTGEVDGKKIGEMVRYVKDKYNTEELLSIEPEVLKTEVLTHYEKTKITTTPVLSK